MRQIQNSALIITVNVNMLNAEWKRIITTVKTNICFVFFL